MSQYEVTETSFVFEIDDQNWNVDNDRFGDVVYTQAVVVEEDIFGFDVIFHCQAEELPQYKGHYQTDEGYCSCGDESCHKDMVEDSDRFDWDNITIKDESGNWLTAVGI